MHIRLTEHARKRCKQWGYNPRTFYHVLLDFPQTEGDFKLRLPGGHEVVFVKGQDYITVITFIHRDRMLKRGKRSG